MEQLEYDARLMNEALKAGKLHCDLLQQLLVSSDIYTDPQALILSPVNVIRLSKELVKGDSYVANARNGALSAIDIIEEALQSGKMRLSEMETSYLPILRDDLNSIPDNESDFIEMMLPLIDGSKFIPAEYGLYEQQKTFIINLNFNVLLIISRFRGDKVSGFIALKVILIDDNTGPRPS